jgi:hypothetical protein
VGVLVLLVDTSSPRINIREVRFLLFNQKPKGSQNIFTGFLQTNSVHEKTKTHPCTAIPRVISIRDQGARHLKQVKKI